MRVVIFGANGATGRLLTRQALDAGFDVVAVTRHPVTFPIEHPRLTVAEGDVHDRRATAEVMAEADVVLSTLGVPFTRKPISLYSDGIASITEAMGKHGLTRVVVVSSSATEPIRHADGGFLLNRVMQPMITRTIGKTTYADMRAMEEHLRSGLLDWTVMRPGGLFDADLVSDYELHEDSSERVFTSRVDLAASVLAQASSSTWSRKYVAVNTVTGVPTLLQMIRREAFGGH
ncbi:NAD(P)H-binding protein [Nocardioides sp. CER19]|uniref:NAD(P)-dependent oxidoreductase n=1 Tax=Nocardioides sp. CER19 TaxID=3038538 RepID=UPI002447442E|nr:NAD(P)H-binding protein [Nocardioides sp. CER19]MDH2416205.1 NAD(P)H-binding protein [Nocardioides sp. CER19]